MNVAEWRKRLCHYGETEGPNRFSANLPFVQSVQTRCGTHTASYPMKDNFAGR
jgi:hypothetical protein